MYNTRTSTCTCTLIGPDRHWGCRLSFDHLFCSTIFFEHLFLAFLSRELLIVAMNANAIAVSKGEKTMPRSGAGSGWAAGRASEPRLRTIVTSKQTLGCAAGEEKINN